MIDDVPVIAGAFVDPAAADIPGKNADSAAERAAAMSRAQQQQKQAELAAAATPAEPIKHRRRWKWRPWLLILGAFVLVAALLSGTYLWTQSQYFVGVDHAKVTIYQGVNTEIGPLRFFTVYHRTNLKVEDLNPSVRARVRSGITAGSQGDAENIVRNLRNQQIPVCSTASPNPGPSTPAQSTPAQSTPARSTPTVATPTRSTPVSGTSRSVPPSSRRPASSASVRTSVSTLPTSPPASGSRISGASTPAGSSSVGTQSGSVSAGAPASGPANPTGSGTAPRPVCRSGP